RNGVRRAEVIVSIRDLDVRILRALQLGHGRRGDTVIRELCEPAVAAGYGDLDRVRGTRLRRREHEPRAAGLIEDGRLHPGVTGRLIDGVTDIRERVVRG